MPSFRCVPLLRRAQAARLLLIRRALCTSVATRAVELETRADELAWLEAQPPCDDARTARFLRLAHKLGASEMREGIDRQLQFSVLPTTMIGSCCTAALLGLDLGAGPFAAAHPLLSQAIVGLLGASTCSSFFFLAHANTVYAGLQYSGNGIGTLQFVQRHGWRFGTLVHAAVATQVFAAGGAWLYVWTPALSAGEPTLLCAAPAFLSVAVVSALLKQRSLFGSLSIGGDAPSEHPDPEQAPEVRHIVAVDGVPPPGGFSRATVHNGVVYVSGTGGSNDTATGEVVAALAFDEARGALENIAAVLRAARSSPERIVVATMLLTDKEDYAECNRAYVEFFAERGLEERLPARSTAMWGVPTKAKVAFSVVATVSET